MKCRFCVCAVVLMLLAADDAKDSASKADRHKLEGTWSVVSAEREGKATDQLNGDQLLFSGEAFTIKTRNGAMKGTFKLDATADPKAAEFTHTNGPQKDKTILAIYAIEGDSLRLCFGDPTKQERPTEFTTQTNPRHLLVILKRGKP